MASRIRMRHWLLVGLAGNCLSIAQAAAQVTSGNVAHAEDGVRNEEIVVTAQRREERLQDVPAAISAFSDIQLERAGIDNYKELTFIAPSVSIAQGSTSPQPTIRGIGSRGNNPGDEQIVPTYVDGVYQPFPKAAMFEFNGIERIEVLRGPQGILLGRNATGGAINVITRTPKTAPRVELSYSHGFEYGENEVKGYVTGGLGRVAADLAISYLNTGGYVKDLTFGDMTADKESLGLRSKLRFEADDTFNVTLGATYIDNTDRTALAVQPINRNSVALRSQPDVFIPSNPYESALSPNFRPSFDGKQRGASVTVVKDFGPFTLTSLTGYQYNDARVRSDSDGTPFIGTSNVNFLQKSKSFNQEVYAVSNGTGPVSWIVGGMYFRDKSGFDPSASVPTNPLYSNVTTNALAAYGQLSYAFDNGLKLTAGGRYSYEQKDLWVTQGATALTDDVSFDNFTPSVTAEYKPNDRDTWYLKYATAFKSGVYNSGSLDPVPTLPEHVKSYEAGVKSDPLPWLRLNLAGYYTDYTDIQVRIRDSNGASVTQNAASAEIYGGEAELFLQPAARFNLRASLSVMSAKYKDYRNAQVNNPRVGGGNSTTFVDASGKRLIKAPGLMLTGGGDYSWDMGPGEASISVNASYQGRSYWDNDNRLSEEPYTMVNAQLSWTPRSKRYRVSLWGENLLNEVVRSTVVNSTSGDFAAWLPPRTWGLRFSVNFD